MKAATRAGRPHPPHLSLFWRRPLRLISSFTQLQSGDIISRLFAANETPRSKIKGSVSSERFCRLGRSNVAGSRPCRRPVAVLCLNTWHNGRERRQRARERTTHCNSTSTCSWRMWASHQLQPALSLKKDGCINAPELACTRWRPPRSQPEWLRKILRLVFLTLIVMRRTDGMQTLTTAPLRSCGSHVGSCSVQRLFLKEKLQWLKLHVPQQADQPSSDPPTHPPPCKL